MFKKKNECISLVGDFDFGEKLMPVSLELIEDAKKDKHTDFAVLFGDIGVKQKIDEYLKSGMKGINNLYKNRLMCARTFCILNQLPKNNEEIEQVIDESHYKFACKYIDENGMITLDNINQVVLPSIIRERLSIYDLPAEALTFSERKIRNIASSRMKQNNRRSWRVIKDFRIVSDGVFIGSEQFTNSNRVPLCRAILFALNEILAFEGYKYVKYYISSKQLEAITKGWITFNKYQHELPYLTNRIEHIKIILKT